MTVEELKTEAKALGYNIIPIVKREKLLPCTCGSTRREHFDTFRNGTWMKLLRCYKCDKEALGSTESGAVKAWNEMIRKENGNERN